MDPRLVWDVWRRILTDDRLVDRVLGRSDDALEDLTAAERAIVDDYARTPEETEINIGMYRDGLVRNALAALSYVPMSQHLLYMSGLDVEAVAVDYVAADGNRDHGPYFWRSAAGFVAYLGGLAEFAGPAHQDVLALDRATAALHRRLGAAGERIAHADARYLASQAAVVVRSRHDLTPWIEEPRFFDPAEALDPSPHCWLVHLPAGGAEHSYAEISERAARMFERLAVPHSAAELAEALDLSPRAVREVVGSLLAIGVVLGGPQPARAAA
jgi:hypothetical protein